MLHPVYPFGAVLRALRRDSGLTILAAADATAADTPLLTDESVKNLDAADHMTWSHEWPFARA